MKVYVIGSLRNPVVPSIGNRLRDMGFEAFDDWHGAGPDADEEWQRYEMERGRPYKEALYGYAAGNVFQFDYRHLNASDMGVLILPAGKSAHLELGYLIGQGKRTYVLFDGEPERWDVMYRFATGVFFSLDAMLAAIHRDTHGFILCGERPVD